MKRIAVLAAVCLVLSAGSAGGQVMTLPGPDGARRALAEELLTLMKVEATVEKTFAVIKQWIPTQMRQVGQGGEMPPGFNDRMNQVMDVIAEEFGWARMKDDYINLYAETFTPAEMSGLIAFFRTPAGQSYVDKQPELVERSMKLSQKMMIQAMPKIQAIFEDLKRGASAPADGPSGDK